MRLHFQKLCSVALLTASTISCANTDNTDNSLLALLATSNNKGGEFCGLSSDGLAMSEEVLINVAGTDPFFFENLKIRDPSAAMISAHDGHFRLQTQQPVEWFEQIPGILHAQRNYVYRMQLEPDDTMFVDLTWPALIAAPAIWEQKSDCSSTVVAVIDSGIGILHSEFSGRMWTNPGEIAGNGIDDDGNGYIDDEHGWDFADGDALPDDRYGHGTHVAGLIGAAGNNGFGVTGVCWNSRLMVLKVFDAAGLTTTDRLISAIDYAVENGASVINLSLGGTGGASGDLMYQALERARSADVLVVAAAGNDGRNNDTVPFYPASYDLDNIIAVASSSNSDGVSSFSNYGALSVDLAAPGESIVSTYPFIEGLKTEERFASIHDWQHNSSLWRVEGVDGIDTQLCGLSDPSGIGRPYSPNLDSMAFRQYDPQGDGPVRVSFLARIDTEPVNDRFEVLWGPGSAAPDHLLTYATGPRFQTMGWIQYSFLLQENGPIQLGFRLRSNDSIGADGVTISSLTLSRQLEASVYSQMSGTSMATPLVTGAAALLRSSDSGCSYASIRNAILTGGRIASAFSGKTVTGRILDLSGAVAAVTCTFP